MESQEPPLIVRLLIFSGRPDPEWTLADEAKEQLLAKAREALGREESNPPPPAGLGYRGFLVRPSRSTAVQLPEFKVFRGVLTVGAGPRAAHRRDVGGVEEFLLAQARERGFGEALEVFGAGPKGKNQGPATLAS
ncbi:MAG: hypothetical protein ACREBG_01070 [Pyrinomonadaceae bacterium]